MNTLVEHQTYLRRIAQRYHVPEHDVLISAAIDLKQFRHAAAGSRSFVRERIELTAQRIAESRRHLVKKYAHAKVEELEKDKCRLAAADWREAREVHRYFHYLGSYRSAGIHLGLYYRTAPNRERLMGVMTLSKYDFAIEPHSIFAHVKRREIRHLSRFYIFDWAPRNTASHFLSQAVKFVRQNLPRVKCLTTCANQDIGHRGTIYQAANWLEVGQFIGAPYLFLNGRPTTVRRLAEQSGTLDLAKLKQKLGRQLVISPAAPLPQKLFTYLLDRQRRRRFFASQSDKVYYFCGYHFAPEYGLSGYRPENAMTWADAKMRADRIGPKVVAGYLERAGSKLYSSAIVKTDSTYHNLRKERKWRSEVISSSRQTLRVRTLPGFGQTILLLCYDAKRYAEQDIRKAIPSARVDCLIVLSYWKENFHLLRASLRRLARQVRPEQTICFDFFHGFSLLQGRQRPLPTRRPKSAAARRKQATTIAGVSSSPYG